MRKAAFAIIIGFSFLVALALLLTQSVVVMQRIAHVSNVSGDVKVKLVAHEADAAVPMGDKPLVQAGDKLITGPDGRVTLNWIDGTRIRVEPNTELTIQKCQAVRGAELAMFRLDLGKIWIRVLRMLSQQDKFEIQTPTATAGVRGTIFSVQVAADGATQVQVYEGQVALESEDDETKVAANNTARLSTGQSSPQVTRFSEQDEQAWQQQVAELGPYLEITQRTFADGTLTIKGRTEREAKLTVGGQAIVPKPNGRFTATVTVPADAEPQAEVVATDRRGYTTTVPVEIPTVEETTVTE